MKAKEHELYERSASLQQLDAYKEKKVRLERIIAGHERDKALK